MKIRVGRRNGHNLYLQGGDVPSDDDICIGFLINPDVAALLAEQASSHPWTVDQVQHALWGTSSGQTRR